MKSTLMATGALAALMLALAPAAANALTLGGFQFNDSKFGDTLFESDGGTFSASNWLNVVNGNPGNSGYLTGASVDTGIANIGFSGQPTYTIGYAGGITNETGFDLGVITARYSVDDSISISFSLDGISFGPAFTYGPGDAVATGVDRTYFYGGSGPSAAGLFVTSIDLSDFGYTDGTVIRAARITGTPQLDLIRVAGFGANSSSGAPEPGIWAMMIFGFFGAGALLRRRSGLTVA